ncbi:MAG TPA: SpaH/EbpB family LPXTG-anchored major pilin [Clostridiales bacterium]|nr:SpaH/EbpB family LPXTG-anchored major pilin [Clostridiales bacterium]
MSKRISTSIFAVLLAIMMMVTMIPSVSAAPTIDTSKKTSLTLVKYDGQAGDTSKPLGGVTFTYLKVAGLMQINDTTAGYTVAYSVTDSFKAKLGLGAADYTDSGTYKATTIQSALNKATDMKSWIKANAGTDMAVTDDTTGITKATDLSQGLYLVVETAYPSNVTAPCSPFVVSLPMPDGFDIDGNSANNTASTDWVYDVTAKPKNETKEAGHIDKNIKLPDGTLTKADDVNIGDDVTFQIDAEVPANVTDLKIFQIVDTLSTGLTYKDVVSVKGIKEDGSEVALSKGAGSDGKNYVVRADGQKVTVAFYNKAAIADCKFVRIELTATLNDKAVIGDKGNPNHADLEYSNTATPGIDDGTTPPEPNDDTKKVPAKDPLVYTYAINIDKINGEGAKLAGATFELYNAKGEKINVAKTTANNYVVKATGTDAIVSTATSNIVISGLDAGTYTLKETVAPAGYNLLATTVTVEIKSTKHFAENVADGSYIQIVDGERYYKKINGKFVELTWEESQIVKEVSSEYNPNISGYEEVTKNYLNVGSDTIYIEQTENVAVKYREVIISSAPEYTMTDGTAFLTVTNNKGFELPVTGGMGTYLFIFGGLMLIGVGTFFFVAYKKKAKKAE